jgi:hypothetical protein
VEEDAQRVSRQREFAEASCQSLEALGAENGGRFQRLLKWIYESRARIDDQMQEQEESLATSKQLNKQLKVKKEQYEAQQRQLEREVEQVQKQ